MPSGLQSMENISNDMNIRPLPGNSKLHENIFNSVFRRQGPRLTLGSKWVGDFDDKKYDLNLEGISKLQRQMTMSKAAFCIVKVGQNTP